MNNTVKRTAYKITALAVTAILTLGIFKSMPANAAEVSNTVKFFSSAPKIDGKVSEEEWGKPVFTVKEGEPNINIIKKDNVKLEDFTADIYLGYDSTHIYIAAVAEYENHVNETIKAGDIWNGDCLQTQISATAGTKRNEFNFACNSVTGKSMADAPQCAGTFSMQGGEGKDYIITRDGNKTVYEIAIGIEQISKDVKELTSGMELPFSLAFHQNGGAFLEYCDGIVAKKDITLAGQIVLGEGSGNSKGSAVNSSDKSNQENTESNTSQTGLILLIVGIAAVAIIIIVVVIVIVLKRGNGEE